MEWVQAEFEYNQDVIDGKYQHRNVDKPSGGKKLEQSTNKDDETIIEQIHARSITLSDIALGLISKTDLLELDGNIATPIEYKRGNTPDTPNKTYDDHIIQYVLKDSYFVQMDTHVQRGLFIILHQSKELKLI